MSNESKIKDLENKIDILYDAYPNTFTQTEKDDIMREIYHHLDEINKLKPSYLKKSYKNIQDYRKSFNEYLKERQPDYHRRVVNPFRIISNDNSATNVNNYIYRTQNPDHSTIHNILNRDDQIIKNFLGRGRNNISTNIMPYVIRKLRNQPTFSVKNAISGVVHSLHSTKANATKQVKLLNAIDHGFVPTKMKGGAMPVLPAAAKKMLTYLKPLYSVKTLKQIGDRVLALLSKKKGGMRGESSSLVGSVASFIINSLDYATAYALGLYLSALSGGEYKAKDTANYIYNKPREMDIIKNNTFEYY